MQTGGRYEEHARHGFAFSDTLATLSVLLNALAYPETALPNYRSLADLSIPIFCKSV
jgi:hypothetical protein